MLEEKKVTKQKDKGPKFQGVGEGIKAYSDEMHGTSSAFPNCPQVREYTENVFKAVGYFFNSYSELTEHKSKKTGLGVNLGFMKFGHKKEKKSMHQVTSKTVNFVAKSYRKGDLVVLDTGDFDEQMSSHAKKMSQEDFYRNYGAYYINSVQTGYYVNIYISIECQSETQAEGIKKEMELKLKTEDGSGELSSGRSNDFTSYINEIGARFEVEHNLPDSAIKEPKFTDIKEAFALLFLVETISTTECNSIMTSSVKPYPSLSESEYAFKNTTMDAYKYMHPPLTEKNLNSEFNHCNHQLSEALEYKDFNSNYTKIDNIDSIIEYYYGKLDLYRTIASQFNENPWADISQSYSELATFFTQDPEFELVPSKFEIGYVLNRISTLSSTGPTTLDKLEALDTKTYFPKIWGVNDIENMYCDQIALYSKNLIEFPNNPPSSSSLYKTFESKWFLNTNMLCDFLVTFIQDELSPWQYSFSSVVVALRWSGLKIGFSATIIYPEKV